MSSELIIKSDVKTNTVIVVFTGYQMMRSINQGFDFRKILTDNFKNVDKIFYIDKNENSYHKGITNITNNILETVNYLRNKLNEYSRVIFMGVSSGGYAAILFGSLLNVDSIIAFKPQTKLFRKDKEYNEDYIELTNVINDITQYYLYGDPSIQDKTDCHHISHCERIMIKSNVFLKKYSNLNLRILKMNGELYNIIESQLKN